MKVNLEGETIQAKLGSMVAYQGDVNFEHAGSGGLARMAKKAVTGEGATLMKIEGKGWLLIQPSVGQVAAAGASGSPSGGLGKILSG